MGFVSVRIFLFSDDETFIRMPDFLFCKTLSPFGEKILRVVFNLNYWSGEGNKECSRPFCR